jgi:hypothetical protein
MLFYPLIPSEYKKLPKIELSSYKLDPFQLMIGSSIIWPTLGKTKKPSLILTLLVMNIKPPLKPNISFLNTSISISETISTLILEIQPFVFLEKKLIVSSVITMTSCKTEPLLMSKLV